MTGKEQLMPCELNEQDTEPKNPPSPKDSDDAMASASSDNSLDLSELPALEEDDMCQISSGSGGNKKPQKIVEWGLRKFSIIVCRKVEAKGRTTYNEVADEIIADLQSLDKSIAPHVVFVEKNIRRRVYDAFNVLIAMNIFKKDKKEIEWVGFPPTIDDEINELEEARMELLNKFDAKVNYLKELEEKKSVDMWNLMLRNQRLHASVKIPSEGVALPFILARTDPETKVEIEMADDMRFVHLDFNGSPFTLHDDTTILKEMRDIALEPENAIEIPSNDAT